MEFCNFCKVPILKLGRVAFHSVTFQFQCLDFHSNQYKKLAPVPSRFCNGLFSFNPPFKPATYANMLVMDM